MSNSEKKEADKKSLEKFTLEHGSNNNSSKIDTEETLNLNMLKMQVDGLTQIMAALQKNFTVMSQVVSGLEKKMSSLVETIKLTQTSLNLSILDILNQEQKGKISKNQEYSKNQNK